MAVRCWIYNPWNICVYLQLSSYIKCSTILYIQGCASSVVSQREQIYFAVRQTFYRQYLLGNYSQLSDWYKTNLFSLVFFISFRKLMTYSCFLFIADKMRYHRVTHPILLAVNMVSRSGVSRFSVLKDYSFYFIMSRNCTSTARTSTWSVSGNCLIQAYQDYSCLM